jgi:hypothetical protein
MALSERQAEAAAYLLLNEPEPRPRKRTNPVPKNRQHPNFDRKDTTLASAEAISVPALIRYQARTEEALMRGVPKRIPQMLRQYFSVDPMPWHTEDLQRMFQGGRWGRLRPTEHGKSTGGLIHFPILSLCEDPEAAHGLIGANSHEAESWLYALRNELETNTELQRDYPWIKPPPRGSRKPWNNRELYVDGRTNMQNRNPSVYATGRGDKSVKGRRFKGIFDDLEGLGTITDTERETLWRWMTQEAWRSLEDPTTVRRNLQCWQGTPFDIDSVYFRLEDLADVEVSRLPYIYPEEHEKAGQLIWAAKRAKIEEFRRGHDPMIFAIAMLLDPAAGNPDILTGSQLVKLGSRLRPGAMQEPMIFCGLDPAGGSKRRGADYCGISVSRVEWLPDMHLPHLEVLYAEAFRLGVYEQVDRVAYLSGYYGRGGYVPVIYEGNSQQRFTYKDHFARQHPEVPVIEFMSNQNNKRDQMMGMSVLKTMFRLGLLHTIEVMGQDSDDGMKTLRKEIRDLGVSKHDHIAKTVWFVVRHMYETNTRTGRRSLEPTLGKEVRQHSSEGYGGGVLYHRVNLSAIKRRLYEGDRHPVLDDAEKALRNEAGLR